jgi:hypothetical protein
MTTKTKVLGSVALIALVATFVTGYWPEHQRRVAAESEAQALRVRVTDLDDHVRAAQLHAGLLDLIDAIEAMNYGQAQAQSSALFDRIRAEGSRTETTRFRSVFLDILSKRDAVTTALAKGDGAAAAPLKEVERTLRQLIGAAIVKSG